MALRECHRPYTLGDRIPNSSPELVPLLPKVHQLAPNSRKNPDESSEISGLPVLRLVVRYARLNLNYRAVLSVGLDIATDAKDELSRSSPVATMLTR